MPGHVSEECITAQLDATIARQVEFRGGQGGKGNVMTMKVLREKDTEMHPRHKQLHVGSHSATSDSVSTYHQYFRPHYTFICTRTYMMRKKEYEKHAVPIHKYK